MLISAFPWANDLLVHQSIRVSFFLRNEAGHVALRDRPVADRASHEHTSPPNHSTEMVAVAHSGEDVLRPCIEIRLTTRVIPYLSNRMCNTHSINLAS
jgi:hypothetical protein